MITRTIRSLLFLETTEKTESLIVFFFFCVLYVFFCFFSYHGEEEGRRLSIPSYAFSGERVVRGRNCFWKRERERKTHPFYRKKTSKQQQKSNSEGVWACLLLYFYHQNFIKTKLELFFSVIERASERERESTREKKRTECKDSCPEVIFRVDQKN